MSIATSWENPTTDEVVLRVRSLERARERQHLFPGGCLRLEAILRCWRRREEGIRVLHHVRHPLLDDGRGGPIPPQPVLRNPVEPPVERPDDAVRGHRGQPALPRVEEGFAHRSSMLYSADLELHLRHSKVLHPEAG